MAARPAPRAILAFALPPRCERGTDLLAPSCAVRSRAEWHTTVPTCAPGRNPDRASQSPVARVPRGRSGRPRQAPRHPRASSGRWFARRRTELVPPCSPGLTQRVNSPILRPPSERVVRSVRWKCRPLSRRPPQARVQAFERREQRWCSWPMAPRRCWKASPRNRSSAAPYRR